MGLFDFSSKDRCLEMLENTSFNPFRVSEAEPELNLPDFKDAFERDLKGYFGNANVMKAFGTKKVTRTYIFNMAESYYNNAGHIPYNILDDIIRQVYNVVQRMGYGNEVGSYEDLRYEVYFALLNN